MHTTTLPGRSDETILLLHGGGVAGWMWEPVVQSLGDERTILIPDLPGHDASADVDYRSHADTIAAVVEMLRDRAGRPVAVVGFSLGAQLAVLLASRHPELVSSAVVVSAQALPTRWPGLVTAFLRLAAPLAKSERFARAQAAELFVPDTLFPAYLRTSRSVSPRTLVAAVHANITFDIPPSWGSFGGVVTILVGADERSLMRRSAAALASAHPKAVVEILPGIGHGLPLQAPGILAAHIRVQLADPGAENGTAAIADD